MTALMEDTYGDGGIPRRTRVTMARSGLVERFRQSGLSGDGEQPVAGARSGALVVLCGWVLCMVAFAVPIKFDEGWHQGAPAGVRWLPTIGFGIVTAGAAVGALLVIAAALLVLPAFLNAWRAEGWSLVRRHVIRLVVVGGVTLAAGGVVIGWAHTLNNHQRNGGFDAYTAAFFAVTLLLVVTVACGTASVISLTTRLTLKARTVAVLGRLAFAMAGALVLMLAGTVWWWVAMAANSPTGIGGQAPVNLIVVVALMSVALGLAAAGVRRVRRALPGLR
jgi:hypothetical protein